LGDPPARRQERLPSWHSDGNRLLQPAHRLHRRRQPGHGLPAEPLALRPQAGTASLVQPLRHLLGYHRLRRGQVGHTPLHLSAGRGHRLPTPLRRRHCAHSVQRRSPAAHDRRPPAGVRDEGSGASPPLPPHHCKTPTQGLFLHQRQYAIDILERAGMSDYKSCSTPVNTQTKLSENDGPPVADATSYRSLTGALQYLTFSRPDIAYAVQQVCLHMHTAREPHLTALKRILHYLRGSLDLDLLLRPSSTSDLVVYTDADWAGCPDTRRSTSGYAVFLGANLVSWAAKRQPVVSRSSAETGRGLLAAPAPPRALQPPPARHPCLLRQHQRRLPLHQPRTHQRTKHVEIDLHFVRERVAAGDVWVLSVPTTLQFVDIFTKGLPSSVFLDFRSSLNVCPE
jgi:hypothetical protein